MDENPRYTLHFTPVEYFARFAPGEEYLPPHFADEGFIHCTDGADNLAAVGNRYYKDDPRDFLVLVIDKERVLSPIRYEDPGQIYPHIYGPLNADAIVDRRPALRNSDGTFQPLTTDD
jgi:uncharacterized protein (DUF952 family)